MADRRPCLHDLPIPQDVQPSHYWTDVMRELADHIGPYATMLLVDALGGTDPCIPRTTENSRYAPIIGEEKAKILHDIYGRERLQLPVASGALRHARRAGVIAAIRAGTLSLTEAAAIRGMGSRSYISHLVNHTDEGSGLRPLATRPRGACLHQLGLFEEGEAA